jgi:hypothetical protein
VHTGHEPKPKYHNLSYIRFIDTPKDVSSYLGYYNNLP